MSHFEVTKPVEVFSGTAWQAEIIKSMLLDNDIQAYLGDEIWGMDAPRKIRLIWWVQSVFSLKMKIFRMQKLSLSDTTRMI